jgi:flavorubredoxin
MSDSGIESKSKAIVVYDTLFGNTEKVAEALSRGIQKYDVEVKCSSIKDADIDELRQYNLIAVGAPTQYLTASRPMKEFLSRLEGNRSLAGKYGFAFDTRYDSFMAGSAAKYIEKRLKKVGIEIIKPHRSGIVRKTKTPYEAAKSDTLLKEGIIQAFETVGNEIGAFLASKRVPIQLQDQTSYPDRN